MPLTTDWIVKGLLLLYSSFRNKVFNKPFATFAKLTLFIQNCKKLVEKWINKTFQKTLRTTLVTVTQLLFLEYKHKKQPL